MRTYLILKQKAENWNDDPIIQALLKEINNDDGSMEPFAGSFSQTKAEELKKVEFDRIALGKRSLPYEKLDQLTVELLMGVR